MKTKKIVSTVLIAALGALIGVFAFTFLVDREQNVIVADQNQYSFAKLPANFDSNGFDFTYAAELSVHAVVHVKTQAQASSAYSNPLYEFFFGEQQGQPRPVVGFGSGVIISNDGYIVTNNHVIEGAEKIFVTLNDNREFKAELIGHDPSTDLALLKIDGKELPYMRWGNSDELKVGEWVLAVGNPFNLTSTVTAGIVSAKGRNLGIIGDNYRIESFIQTDAALNRGNSGGALVDIEGKLVGINTAILSPSGGYAGNSFAVPVTIVKKVVTDLKEYGAVQRAILGVTIRDVTADLAKEKDFDILNGVYVEGLREGGAAKKAGIEEGDIITQINDSKVNSSAELQEEISKYRPGDEVKVTVIRNGKKKHFDAVLRNLYGDVKIVKAGETIDVLGARFEEITSDDKRKLRVDHGVKVTNLSAGKFKESGIKEGFIITQINNKPVHSTADVKNIVENTDGGVYIEGVYPNGMIAYYAFGME
ncbi:MAG: Do family serine endopeptidase [Bacteroidetes bacterium]|nr:Do family serine endopeptidase [Bacteroidota bacterium]